MVRRILNLIHREIRGLHEAAYLLGVFAILSQLLALVRDRLLANFFGAGTVLDIYYAAFRIPDLIFVGVASLVSVYVLIPFFSEIDSRTELRRFINSIFSVFAFAIVTISATVFVFTPQLLSVFFPGLVGGEYFTDLVLLTRILLVQPFFLGVSGLFASITQTHQRFILYALSPLFYNLSIIVGVLFFYPIFGISGLGIGVVIGAFLHMFIQIPYLFESNLIPRLTFSINFSDVKRVVLLSLPRTLALSSNQITFLFLIAFASLMVPGSITIFNLSFNLQSVPLVIIGASYSVAAFPTLAKLFSRGEKDKFFEYILVATRHIIFWSLPAVALFIVLRAQIVRVILGSGAFDWDDTRLTAAALAIFSLSLVAQALVLLLVRGYYAAGKTLWPLVVNLISSLLIIVFAFTFVGLFTKNAGFQQFIETVFRVEGIPGTVVLMLPLSYTLGLLFNASVLFFLFQRDFQSFYRTIMPTVLQSFAAAFAVGFTSYLFLNVFDDFFDINTFWGIFAQGLIAGVAGIIVGFTLLHLLGSKEAEDVWKSLHRRFWKSKPIVSDEGVS